MSRRSRLHYTLTTIGYWALRIRARLPRSTCLLEGSLSFGAPVRYELPSHTTSRQNHSKWPRQPLVQVRATAFHSWLPPIGPIKDFHLQSLRHARRKRVGFAILPAYTPSHPNPVIVTVIRLRITRPMHLHTPAMMIPSTITVMQPLQLLISDMDDWADATALPPCTTFTICGVADALRPSSAARRTGSSNSPQCLHFLARSETSSAAKRTLRNICQLPMRSTLDDLPLYRWRR